jgi:hypothetical protein
MAQISSKIAQLCFVVFFIWLAVPSLGKYSGGTGEPNNPYLIATPNDLNSIGLNVEDFNKCFLMVADINLADFTGGQFNIIGPNSANPFTGVFDGNEHIIMKFTYGEGTDYSALFSIVYGAAQVKNVTMFDAEVNDLGSNSLACLVGLLQAGQVSNCHVINGRVNGEHAPGLLVGTNYSKVVNCSSSGVCYAMQGASGLVGRTREYGTIINCYSDANVIVNYGIAGGLVGSHEGDLIVNCHSAGKVEGLASSGKIGGLVGYNSSVIEQCYSTAEVIGGNDEGIGGLVGINNDTGTVSKCFATGDVSGIIDVGGLVGYNYSGGTISDSYSLGDINALSVAGGLVSGNKGILQRCYSAGKVSGPQPGGLVSHGPGTIIACFWDIEASDCNVSDGGTGLPTAQMQKRSTFADAGWDMINVWDIGEGQTYPFLRTHLPSDINKDNETNFYDFAIVAENWLKEE